MSYEPKEWSSTTPITVSSLNHIESGISEAHGAISEVNEAITEVIESIAETDSRVDQIANNQIPEEYVQEAVEEYVNENSGGFATKTDLGQLSSEIVDVENDFNNGNKVLLSDYVSGFVGADGNIEANASVITQAELQPISANETIGIDVKEGYSYGISWYNSKKELAKRANSWLTVSSEITNNYSYYRLSILKNGITTEERNALTVRNLGYYLSREESTNKVIKLEKITDIIGESIFHIYKNCVCIGDSLTRGYYSENTPNENGALPTYPQILAKITNWTVSNVARAGYSAKEWYNAFIETDFSQFDVAIIYLGTNEGLESYTTTDTSNTNLGCYRKIIQKILADNPNCKIFMCNLVSTSGDLNVSNVSITLLANEFDNCNVIDLLNNGIVDLTRADLHPNDSVHFGAIGYSVQASVIATMIKNVVSNNIGLFDIAN